MASPAVLNKNLVGSATTQAAGSEGTPRTDTYLHQLIAAGRAPAAHQTVAGVTFAGFIPPGTGQAPGTAIGTTGAFTLALAAGVAYRLVVRKIMVGYISGTMGAGVLALLAHQSATSITAPTGGTVITPSNLSVGNQTASQANCRFNNTVPASGLMIRSICSLGASLASTAVQPWQVIDPVDGEVIVLPGNAVSVQGIAAGGTSPLVTVGMIWTEEATS